MGIRINVARKPTLEEIQFARERDRLRNLLPTAELLYAIVESGSKTPDDDCKQARKLLSEFADTKGAQHPQVGWIADSIGVSLHVMWRWESIPFPMLRKVLDRLIVAIESEADSAERARASAEYMDRTALKA